MKYGILTFCGIPNYGAVLQAYSLCMVLRDIGVDCEIIDYTCDTITERELVFSPDKNLFRNFAKKVIWKLIIERRIKECMDFTTSFGVMSKKKYNKNSIIDSNQYYDGFISGSDQIWNSKLTGGDLSYYLQFANKDKIKIAYGSSFGNDFPNCDAEDLLKKYDHISVREKSGCTIINEFGIECLCVVDPTMLLNQESWKKIKNNINRKNYVIVYYPDKDLLSSAYKYAKKNSKKIFVIGNRKRKIGKCLYLFNPREWLGYLSKADMVFTNSYHGILFSMYFNVPFITNRYDNRISYLLETFQLENRYLLNCNNFSEKIDYDKVNILMSKLRQTSLNYLREATE